MNIILVTGGSGFIGGHFIDVLYESALLDLSHAYHIINMDTLSYPAKEYKHDNKLKHYSFIKGDITDVGDLNAIFDRFTFDAIVHFAAESHVDRSIIDAEKFIQTNIMGTKLLMDYAIEHWQVGIDDEGYPIYKDGVKFMYISTDEVYGDLVDENPFKESDALRPSNPYAVSKASADMLVQSYGRTYKLPYIITRCVNNYGIYQHQEKLVPNMIHKACESLPLKLYGDGKQVREWIHVVDHCKILYQLLKKGKVFEIYNIGSGVTLENLKLTEMILDYMNKPRSLISFVNDRLGHDRRYGVNSEKIKTHIQELSLGSFEALLKHTIQWYMDYFEIYEH